MFTYKSEAAFSKALCSAMKNKGIFVQRIESGLTGRGIPDIYAIVGNTALWIELKRIKHNCGRYEAIPWRPGQQAWLTDVYKRGQQAITLCCFNDCILKIVHETVYFQNVVDIKMHKVYYSIKDLLK